MLEEELFALNSKPFQLIEDSFRLRTLDLVEENCGMVVHL